LEITYLARAITTHTYSLTQPPCLTAIEWDKQQITACHMEKFA